jgi:hypothetical protein
MYINKIDDLINDVLDDFYSNVILKNKMFIKIFQESNFVKYQKEINAIMIEYINGINTEQIRELVKNSDSIHTITETIKRYVAVYLFLLIGINYKGRDDTFINNIVEFSKNQPEYNYKIDKFFNSESNSQIIKYFTLIRQILTLIDADAQQRKDIFTNRHDYKDTVAFLNDLGSEYVETQFKVKDKNEQSNNIIKTIIVLLLYKTNERKEFFRLLEMAESMDGDYMFIDIVVPTKRIIDFNTIESLLSKRDIMNGLATVFWEYLTESEDNIKSIGMSADDKILQLMNAGVLVPIVDDFLLYHKDSEKYDKNVDPAKIKKKEDTKIRFIINKIDMASELYSENTDKANAKKQFYVPLLNRKAVTINDYEEIKIINKFINQGKRSVENNEYFNDLLEYRSYPYVNFKEFKKNGFSIMFTKTIDAVRAVSLETSGDFKQNNKSRLQMRVGSKDMMLNVVGFVIPTNLSPIECVRVNDLVDIKSVSKNKNGMQLMLKYLDHSLINSENHSKSVYWLFDLETDEVVAETYEQTSKFTKQDQMKNIVGKLYDVLIEQIYSHILEKLEKKNLYIQVADRIINSVEKHTLRITDKQDIKDDLETELYQNLIYKGEAKYDIADDIIHGMSGEVLKLPKIEKKKKTQYAVVKMDLAELDEKGEHIDEEKIEGVCQHNITWEKLNDLKKAYPKRYMDDMYAFIQQYVVENIEHQYVCKSCGFHLNMKKFTMDGVFDNDSQKFITYSMPMEVPLEEISEYEKYKISIRNIDKLIEKLSLITNIAYFSDSTTTARWRRKSVVKSVIDLVLLNNGLLRKNFKERNEMASKMYGISRDLSNLFVFELDNSIFMFSSKDKDHYKPIKQNNMLAYIIFLTMLELNDSQITYITGDKKGFCNFPIFDKVYSSLFEGLKFLKNNKGDTINVKNYKIFCYVLYMMSCMASKYNMWYYEYKDPKDVAQRKKMMPVIQKIIIHTVIDVINSVLENSDNNKNYIYEVIASKFYNKLNTTFSNEDLYKRFKDETKASLIGDKKNFVLTKPESIQLTGQYLKPYDLPTTWSKCRPPKLLMEKKYTEYIIYHYINNITNCDDGRFHNWKSKSDTLQCSLCNAIIKDLNVNEDITKTVTQNHKYIRLSELATKYCIDGTHHQFALNDKGNNLCIKCKKEEKYKYSNAELNELDLSLKRNQDVKNEEYAKRQTELTNKSKEEEKYYDDVKNKVAKQYRESITKDNKYKFIDDFVNDIQSILGSELNNTDIHLRDNAYIIDHDYLGYPLDKPVVITDKDNKISYKSNHPFFKTDVIFYTSYKGGKIDVFYDATTNMFLGFKEESKGFVSDKKPDKKIKISYSIYNKLRYMGYQSLYMNILDYIDDAVPFKPYNNGKEYRSEYYDKEVAKYIIRNRIDNLKKTIYKFQRLLTRILNSGSAQQEQKKKPEKKQEGAPMNEETNFFTEKIDSIIEKYKKKFTSVTIADNSGNHHIFKHWKGVSRSIYPADMADVAVDFSDSKLISADTINSFDENGNIILFYIVSEMSKLMKYNEGKFTKTNVSMFLIDFINNIFEIYNEDILKSNLDIKRFKYILHSSTFIEDIQDKMETVEGVYEEYRDPDDEMTEEEIEDKENAEEEADAIDIDTEFDYMSQYDKTLDWEPDSADLAERFTGLNEMNYDQ